jgi:micrococcal nuclease
MNPKIRRPLPFLLLILLCAPLLAQTFTARVIRVIDGDTVAVLSGATETRIRLAECDAPESAQPFGPNATHFTTSIALGHTVTVYVQDKDHYGRTIAHIITEQGLDVSTELIRVGFAWWYRQYSRNPALGDLEAQAHSAHRGLWIDPNPTPPWNWRHTHESVSYQKR